jgi:hypothetical protein
MNKAKLKEIGLLVWEWVKDNVPRTLMLIAVALIGIGTLQFSVGIFFRCLMTAIWIGVSTGIVFIDE